MTMIKIYSVRCQGMDADQQYLEYDCLTNNGM